MMPSLGRTLCACACLLIFNTTQAQFANYTTTDVIIDFGTHLRDWDGFGVNYVQTAQTRDYSDFAQEYGGFSLLTPGQKNEINELIFGKDGLKPGLIKMFLDPLHQKYPGGPYDHTTTTRHMLDFVSRGLKTTRSRGDSLQIITTLYGPPAYMTLQKELRGRDMDWQYQRELGLYLIDWIKYLQNQMLPVRYLSLHNEGEDWRRWPADGTYANFDHGHDYNMYWRPDEVAKMVAFLPRLMQEQGIEGVGVTPGETSRWFQFHYGGYARALIENDTALAHLGLLTSHNFYNGEAGHRWFSGSSNVGTDWIRSKRPDVHAWVTSASWGNMDVEFAWQIWMNIYLAKVNGYIPWACIQRPTHWLGGDPNPGTAIRVREDSTYEITKGYYLYKQFTRAGQPHMAVAYTKVMDSEIQAIGFAQHQTENPDAFIVINSGVHADWRADRLEVYLGNERFSISMKDTTRNMDYTKNGLADKPKVIQTKTGYRIHLQIKKANVSEIEAGKSLPFNLILTDGEYAIAGKKAWKSNGMISLTEVESGDAYLPMGTGDVPDIAQWYVFHENIHPNTPTSYGGKWRGWQDQDRIYLEIIVNDRTNLMARKLNIQVKKSNYGRYMAYRTTDFGNEAYTYLGTFEVDEGQISYLAPPRSVTTFFGVEE